MKHTILMVVDDVKLARSFSKHVLQRHPEWRIITARSYEEAVSITKFTKPDVALIRLILPDGNGLDLMRELKLKFPHLSIILISHSPSDDLLAEVHKLGKCNAVGKPGDIKNIISEIENMEQCA